jgi:membrane associated rhomboid family serine protease
MIHNTDTDVGILSKNNSHTSFHQHDRHEEEKKKEDDAFVDVHLEDEEEPWSVVPPPEPIQTTTTTTTTKEHVATTAILCDIFVASSDCCDYVDACLDDFWMARTLRRNQNDKDKDNKHLLLVCAVPTRGFLALYQHEADVILDLEWAKNADVRRYRKKNRKQDDGSTQQSSLSWSGYQVTRQQQQQQWHTPYVTRFLMMVWTVSLLVSLLLEGIHTMAPLRANPMMGPSSQTLVRMGAMDSDRMTNDTSSPSFELYRLFTAMFVHAGIIHYIVNMQGLRCFGRAVERAHGSILTAVVFIVSAVGANATSALLLVDTVIVGATGGVFALMGMCVNDIVVHWGLIIMRDVQKEEQGFDYKRILVWLGLFIGVSALLGLVPFIDNNHLAGLLYGMAFGLPLMHKYGTANMFNHHYSRQRCDRRTRLVNFLVAVSLYVTTISLLVTQKHRLDEEGQLQPLCPNCQYLSCISFPFWAKNNNKWWNCHS